MDETITLEAVEGLARREWNILPEPAMTLTEFKIMKSSVKVEFTSEKGNFVTITYTSKPYLRRLLAAF